MTGLAAGIGARAVLGGLGARLKAVPTWAWVALAVAVTIFGACLWFDHQIDAAREEGAQLERAKSAAAFNRLRVKADGIRQRSEALSGKISTTLKGQNDETNRRIAADAAGLRLSGPGAAGARCVDHSGVPAAAGEPVAGRRAGHASAAELLATDWHATVSWRWLVDRAEQCDLNRAEALIWRDWYEQQALAHEVMRNQARAAVKKELDR